MNGFPTELDAIRMREFLARQELEALLIDDVRAARNAGYSWDQIGEALGVSRQAAHKRYAQHCA